MLRAMLIQSAVFVAASISVLVLLYVIPITNSGLEFRVLVLASGLAALGVPVIVSYTYRKRSLPSTRVWLVYGIVFAMVNLVLWATITLVALRVALTWAA